MEKAERQIEAIFDYLRDYISTNGYSPSYREISFGVGLKSTNSIKAYLDILEQRGLISRQTNKNRTIEIVGNHRNNTIELPLVGQVAAGEPILAEQNIEEYVTFSNSFFSPSKNLFMLKVKGESMIEIGINNGDFVVVSSQNSANNGEVVVAMIDGNATVKTFYKEPDRIRLQPANKLFSPIYSKDVQILGKVVGVVRKM